MRFNLRSLNSWSVVEECGGEQALLAILTDFYNRVFDDIIIGFLFAQSDQEALTHSQFAYVAANLGDRSGDYTGPPIRQAHLNLPILPGHFDRRHQILADVLNAHNVPSHVVGEWLAFDQSLRPLVVNTGATARDRILED